MKKKDLLLVGIVSLVAIAAIIYMIVKKQNQHKKETPAANAPQLDIQNPGDQSDFPAAPTTGKGLG